MDKNLFSFSIVMAAYSFFIVCPRMAAMTNLISKNFTFPIYWLVFLGTIISIPLLIIMTWIIRQWGLLTGLGFAILTDILSALIMGTVNIKAAIETFIIAIFVVAGNRVAVWITSKIF